MTQRVGADDAANARGGGIGARASNELTGADVSSRNLMTVNRISVSATMLPGGSWMTRATGWREDSTTAWTLSLGIIDADLVDGEVTNLLAEVAQKLSRVDPPVTK